MNPKPPLRLFQVLFKKGLHGVRIVHREYVRATGMGDACDRMRKQAQGMAVVRLTAIPVPDDDEARQREARSKVAFCRKAGH